MRKDAKAELIGSLPLVAGCTAAEVAEVAAIADEIGLAAGRKLATEHADGQEFVVIIDEPRRSPRADTVVNTIGAGDIFGEIALLHGTPRTASVVASTAVQALVIEGHAFRRLLEDAPEISAKVERVVAERAHGGS